MSKIFLVEISYYDPTVSGGASGTLYFSSGKGYITKPSDTPSNKVFLPVLIDPGNYSRYLFAQDSTRGRFSTGKGDIILNNAGAPGLLDNMINYAYDGRVITIRYGDETVAYPGGFQTIFSGTMRQVLINWTQIIVKLYDNLTNVSTALMSTTTYLGTNSGTSGVEGLPADLLGKYKPILYGQCFNIPAPAVNTSSLTYQVSTTQGHSLDAVYDKGEALTAGTARASLAALLAGAPAASHYDYYLGSGGDGFYFKLGSTPAGEITCDATQGANASARTVAQIVKAILKGPGGLADANLDLSSYTALDTANSSVVGIWVDTSGQVVGDAIDELVGSIGAYWSQLRSGLITVGQLVAPTGSAVSTIQSWQLTGTVETVQNSDTSQLLPNWRIIVDYQKLYKVQTPTDLAAGVTQAQVLFLGQQRRSATPALDNAIAVAHPQSQTYEVPTLLVDATAAANEATRLLALYGTRRDLLNISIPRSFSSQLDIGNIITLKASRYDWTGGKKFVILGIEEQYTKVDDILHLWG